MGGKYFCSHFRSVTLAEVVTNSNEQVPYGNVNALLFYFKKVMSQRNCPFVSKISSLINCVTATEKNILLVWH